MRFFPGAPASLDSRAAALAIDISVYALLAVLIFEIGESPTSPQNPFLRWGIFTAFNLLYWIGFAYRGNTLGKWFVGLRLVDGDGRTPGFQQCFKRSLFPGVVWFWSILSMPGLGWSEQLKRDDSWPGLLVPLFVSLFIWAATAKIVVPPDLYSYYNDRNSGTSFVRCPGYVWFLKWIGHLAREGVRFVQESVYRKGKWMQETVSPLGLDVRRLGAWVIDLTVLWLAYRILRSMNGEKGLFAQSGSWYFVFMVVAAVVLWVLPSLGYSPGKALLNVRIVNWHGQPPGLRAAFMRAAVPGTIWIVLLLIAPQRDLLSEGNWIDTLLWLALVIFSAVELLDLMTRLDDPYQRGLRDLAARTLVIHRDNGLGAGGYPERLPDDVHWRLMSATSDVKNQAAGEKSEGWVKPARRRRRAVGFVIDFVIAVNCLEIAAALLPGYENHYARLLAQGAVLIGYFVGLVALWGTPGSWLAGVRVVKAKNGRAPGFARALVRLLPYTPVFILPLFDTSFLYYHFESNELVMMARDLVLLWLLIVLAIDALAFVRRDEAMHNRIAGTTVTRSAVESKRDALGTWIVEKWRWLNGDEPNMTLTLTGTEH